jgi:hypothetical protein
MNMFPSTQAVWLPFSTLVMYLRRAGKKMRKFDAGYTKSCYDNSID